MEKTMSISYLDIDRKNELNEISKLQYQIELVLNYDLRTNQYNEYISSKCISNNSSGVL
ncbi:hypothetical protein [Clostridium perfringens]|uniref:hypothetical protein n=1 Tax=Clostridium perfringens TaxID=1502 RepID=UPI001FAA47BA|nr:hypothetical protein [Clostridium perfringens]